MGTQAMVARFSRYCSCYHRHTRTFEALIEVGVRQPVIQNKRGANEEYLNTAWWIQVVRGLCLFAAASLLAPWRDSFYDNQELSKLLQVAFLAVAFQGLISPRTYVLEKLYYLSLSEVACV